MRDEDWTISHFNGFEISTISTRAKRGVLDYPPPEFEGFRSEKNLGDSG